jgi:aspartyl-tRNA(Asn)/glutamyl-tRNA(Gln) amidotransferase subunit A
MTDLHWLTLEEVATRIRERAVSAEETVRACLERIEQLEPQLGAFITVTGDAALDAARALDQAGTKGAGGPLQGVPIALKDLFDTAGVRTTAGSKIFADRVPSANAEVVRRLLEDGAIVIGKTNLHEWAFGVTTQNPHFGPTRNPWDPSRIPGGSSGGSGAALAAGLCYGALGSDTGGSIRIPASLCGIVGLKPTFGRVSVRGSVPLAWSLDHAGPMARTVRDVALLYAAIAGFDTEDPTSADMDLDDPLAEIEDGVRGLRLGLPRQHFFAGTEPEIVSAVREAARLLEREGAVVEEIDLPRTEALLPTQTAIIGTEAAAFHRERMGERPQDFGADVLERLRRGAKVAGAEYVLARREQLEIRHAWIRALGDYAAVLTPTTAIAAPPADGQDALAQAARLTARTSPFNLTGLPAMSIPCGLTSEGLPMGLQIASGPWMESRVLRVARSYERASESIGSPASLEPRIIT